LLRKVAGWGKEIAYSDIETPTGKLACDSGSDSRMSEFGDGVRLTPTKPIEVIQPSLQRVRVGCGRVNDLGTSHLSVQRRLVGEITMASIVREECDFVVFRQRAKKMVGPDFSASIDREKFTGLDP